MIPLHSCLTFQLLFLQFLPQSSAVSSGMQAVFQTATLLLASLLVACSSASFTGSLVFSPFRKYFLNTFVFTHLHILYVTLQAPMPSQPKSSHDFSPRYCSFLNTFLLIGLPLWPCHTPKADTILVLSSVPQMGS